MAKSVMLKRKGCIIGEHTHYDSCRFCLQKTLHPFLSFGNVPLAGGFFSKAATESDFAQERLYPLEICFCTKCGLVQVSDVVDHHLLFDHYFYHSSAIGTLVHHFEEYAQTLTAYISPSSSTSVVEIGCNDGVFLRPLIRQGYQVLGVDPAVNIVTPLLNELPIMCACFGEQTAQEIVQKQGKADVILGSNCLAHIDDMHDVLRGVTCLLKDDGFLSMETHYIGTLLRETQYDFMYHEHQSYYSLYALEKFFAMYEMEVFDVQLVPMHGGSIRYFVQKKRTGKRSVTDRVLNLREQEKKLELHSLSTFHSFSSRIATAKKDLLELLSSVQKQGKTVAAYGASGRSTMIMSYCGITKDQIAYVIDDAPAKIGAFTPGNHLPIVSSAVLRDPQKRPDYCIILAWAFADEIVQRNKVYTDLSGVFVVPLPTVKILS
ncbi:hypothetical protein C5B42_05220 [Candidatus Cerribacteria bacterium 'Amazon FNV 2010 28 9']|uniref:SAM-dependent methyltransferase n=1 Tax=Candidatus Cerribacteria bacterium 'Amazon FNV 2010 28 9' TaxID=2081795 RepID=A0A317JNN1_9BACT|nr:MAG: hypothetical protein C5B42_05220 [Candidatus Cerribacteria bacterium 'Amazon FNV 2010 28 9']